MLLNNMLPTMRVGETLKIIKKIKKLLNLQKKLKNNPIFIEINYLGVKILLIKKNILFFR